MIQFMKYCSLFQSPLTEVSSILEIRSDPSVAWVPIEKLIEITYSNFEHPDKKRSN
jgi:hypothetical protein